jgi:glycopeptide antibiotics resistance protein
MILVWPWCVAFSASVEFLQLFFPDRTCSGSDIIAQGLGSLTGMLVWLAVGDRLVHRFRLVWQGDRIGGTAGRILFAYVGLLGLVMWLPLDLTLSPAELYHKNLEAKAKMVLVPFEEITQPGGAGFAVKRRDWLELAGLYSLAGMLAAGINRWPWNTSRGLGGVAWRGALLALTMEAGQLFVMSRTTSVTDVLVGTLGVLAGWGVVRAIRPTQGRGLSLNLGLLLGQAWIGLLLAVNWLPFDFDASIMRRRLSEVNWVPFATQYEKNYMNALEEAMTKTLLFAPLGAVVAAMGLRRIIRKRTAIALGVLVAAIIEAGQLALPSRIAGPTDLIFGGVGSWLGASVALRLRAFGFGEPPRSPVRFKVT